jgi:hypothetical protein
MDALNEELMRDNGYPREDPDYDNPWWSKGTEMDTKTAEVEMHTAPKILPPRYDQRSILDEDIKKEMDDDPDMKTSAIKLTSTQEAVWHRAHAFYLNEQGRTSKRAAQLATDEVAEQWPELKQASVWLPSDAPESKTARIDRGESFTATFANLTGNQASEFKRLFAWMNRLGGVGSSRQFTVNFDGDGGARCRISVDGEDLTPDDEDMAENDKTDYNDLRFSFE